MAEPAPVSPIPYATPNLPPDLDFPDQRGGMKAMGAVMIVIGAFSACFAVFTPLALLFATAAGGGPAMMARDVIGAAAVYGVLAAMLITTGVGSLRIRRWSRPVVLVLTGTWLVGGITALVSFLIAGAAFEQAASMSTTTVTTGGPGGATTMTTTTAPANVMVAVGVLGVVMLLVFGVLLPGGYFWFYVRRSVRQTLDYFDPRPAWTDRCPTPVLAVAAWLVLAALMTLNFCLWGVFPMFGRLISGPPAIAALVATALVLTTLAVGAFRLRTWAWWGTVVLLVAYAVNSVVTFTRVDPLEFYRLSGTPPETISTIEQLDVSSPEASAVMTIAFALAGLGYLLWVRKYFRRDMASGGQPATTP